MRPVLPYLRIVLLALVALLFVAAESELQALDTATGEKLFSFDREGTISSGPASPPAVCSSEAGSPNVNTTEATRSGRWRYRSVYQPA